MKRISNIKVEIINGKLHLSADIDEHKFEQPVQQVTVGYLNPENMSWPRHCQISHDAFFIKAFGNGVGIMLDDLIKIASLVEPKTSFPPKINKSKDGKLDNTLTVDICSELNPSIQWEQSDDLGIKSNWIAIEGETSPILDKSKAKSGKFVRCVAFSDAGSVATHPIMIA